MSKQSLDKSIRKKLVNAKLQNKGGKEETSRGQNTKRYKEMFGRSKDLIRYKEMFNRSLEDKKSHHYKTEAFFLNQSYEKLPICMPIEIVRLAWREKSVQREKVEGKDCCSACLKNKD
jgi:hypothetical protein